MVPPDAALATFDQHLHDCGSCLSVGNDLCYEGEYLADRLRATQARPRFVPRRPAMPRAQLPEVFA